MSRAPVLFRVDAGPRLGWEHLSRCLVFAAALQRRRRPAYFLSQLDPGSLGLTVKRGGNEWIDADAPAGAAEDLEEMVREVRRIRPAAVVVDSPDVKEEYLAELRRMGVLVVSIDSAAGVRFPSRLVINPLLAPDRESYEFVRGAQVLLGARYAIVRPEIRRQRPIRRRNRSSRFAPWSRSATTTRTARPASWPSCCSTARASAAWTSPYGRGTRPWRR